MNADLQYVYWSFEYVFTALAFKTIFKSLMPYHGLGHGLCFMTYHYVMHNKNKHLLWAFVYCISFVCDLQLVYVNMVFLNLQLFEPFCLEKTNISNSDE